MAEIIFRLPSKKIQYGYVEVHATPDELGLNLSDATDLGVVYANYAASFLEGEVMGVDAARAARGLPSKPEVQKPAGKPVDGVSGVSQVFEGKKPSPMEVGHKHTYAWGDDGNGHSGSFCACGKEEPRTISQIMSDEDVDTEAEAAEILKRELGATEIKEYAVGDTVEVAGMKFTKHSEITPVAPWERSVAPKVKPWENDNEPPMTAVDLGNLF